MNDCTELWTHSVRMGDLNQPLIFDGRYSVKCKNTYATPKCTQFNKGKLGQH